MVLAGAALVVPSTARPPVAGQAIVAPEAITWIATAPKGLVTTSETFRRQPEAAIEGLIHEAAERFGLAPALIRAVIRAESGFDPFAVSSAGAQGLMQLMPALATELGVANVFDPRENIMAGTQYLSALISGHGGSVTLGLASYNAGPGAVERYGGIPPFKETERYVQTILDLVARSEPAPD